MNFKMTKTRGLIGTIIVFMIGTWLSVVDKKAESYVNRALVEARVSYGSARTLNAGISVLQGTDVKVSFGVGGKIAIGEV